MTRILVIEAEETSRHALRSILENAGYDVAVAADSQKGQTLHRNDPVDLVIDAHMEATEGPIASPPRFANARVLTLTGSGLDAEGLARMRAASGKTLLPKPFRRGDLLSAVKATLEE